MQDPLWMRAFLAVHITAGSGAFVLAPLALVTAKGGRAHRLWGKVYFWCMTVVAATAMVMALYRSVLFLALVAVFSFYSAFVAKNPRARAPREPRSDRDRDCIPDCRCG